MLTTPDHRDRNSVDRSELAGLGRRFAATLVDGILFASWMTVGIGVKQLRSGSITDLTTFLEYANYGLPWALATEGVLVGMTGATLGKLALGIRVVAADVSPVGFSRALIRWLSKFLSAVFLVGYVLAFFDRQRRTLHDRMAGTLVVLKSSELVTPPQADEMAPGTRWDLQLPLITLVAVGIGAVGFGLIQILPTYLDPTGTWPNGVLRFVLLFGLQGMVGGLVRRDVRMTGIGFAAGASAGALTALLVLFLSQPDAPYQPFANHVFLIPRLVIGWSVGVALRSRELSRWGAAAGCVSFLIDSLILLARFAVEWNQLPVVFLMLDTVDLWVPLTIVLFFAVRRLGPRQAGATPVSALGSDTVTNVAQETVELQGITRVGLLGVLLLVVAFAARLANVAWINGNASIDAATVVWALLVVASVLAMTARAKPAVVIVLGVSVLIATVVDARRALLIAPTGVILFTILTASLTRWSPVPTGRPTRMPRLNGLAVLVFIVGLVMSLPPDRVFQLDTVHSTNLEAVGLSYLLSHRLSYWSAYIANVFMSPWSLVSGMFLVMAWLTEKRQVTHHVALTREISDGQRAPTDR